MNTKDPNHPVQLAAQALRALTPEDQRRANDIARDVPTKPDYYFARADGVVAIAFVDEPTGVGSKPLRAWFADGKSRDLRDDSIERWGPRIPRWDPDQPEDCTLTWLMGKDRQAILKWQSLCERLDADPASAVSKVMPTGLASKWNSLCVSLDLFPTASVDEVHAAYGKTPTFWAGDWQALCAALGMSPECNAEDLTKAALELRKTIGDANEELAAWCPEVDPSRCSLSGTVRLLVSDVLEPNSAVEKSFKRSLGSARERSRKAIERIAELEANATPDEGLKDAALWANVNAAKRAAALAKAPLVPCCAGFWWCSGKPHNVFFEGTLLVSLFGGLVSVYVRESRGWAGPCIAPGETWGEGVWAARMAEAEKRKG